MKRYLRFFILPLFYFLILSWSSHAMDDLKVQDKTSQGPAHVELDTGVLITPEEIHKLRQSHPDLSSNPIQVDIFASRADGRFETLHDLYVREDEKSPITRVEVFEKFSMKELLSVLLNNPPSPLFFTVGVRISGQKESIDKSSIMNESQIRSLGLLGK